MTNVNVSLDVVVPLSPWLHDILIPPAPAVPGPSYDIPCTQAWIGAKLSGSFTTTVWHRFFEICLDGHNVGMLVPHITYPVSPMLAVIMPLSERKMTFSASTVEMNKKAVACAALIALPPLPMMDCGDPVGNQLTPFPMNFFNTVEVGMTLMDFVFGFMGIAIDVGLDLLFFKYFGGGGKFKNLIRPYKAAVKGGKKALEKSMMRMAKAASKAEVKKAGEEIVKKRARRGMREGTYALGKFVPTSARSAKKWALKTLAKSGLESAKAGHLKGKVKVGRSSVGEIGFKYDQEEGGGFLGSGAAQSVDTKAPSPVTGTTSETPSSNAVPIEGNSPPDNLTP